MSFGNPPCDRQAQAGAFRLRIETDEPLEDALR